MTEFPDECNRTAAFTKTEIAVENESVQFYSLSYMVQREEYVLTVYTRLEPLNLETFATSFIEMNCAPTGESGVVSMEFVEFNSSVTLPQQYAVLGKVAKEIGKVYEKSGNETLAQLTEGYYTMEEEAKYLSKLVEKQLKEHNLQILQSSAILMDIGCDFNCVVECLLFLAPPDVAAMCIYSCNICVGSPAPFNPACGICIGCITTYAIACAYYC
jgi:hypothetical protein